MVNYQNGKIYKIVDKTNNNIYIGSTTEKYLSQRLQKHIYCYKKYINPNKKQYYMTSFEIIKNNDFEILLLETYPCNNKYELEQRERYYIENNVCINKVIPTRTHKEWHKVYCENNKEKIKEKKKEYYENNKDKIKEKNKEYYEKNKIQISKRDKKYYEKNKTEINEKRKEKVICDLCGTQVSKYCLNRHKKSNKCKRLSICMIEDD